MVVVRTPGGGAVEIVADGSAVLSGVSGDVRDRDAPIFQCVYLHVFFPCKHEIAGPLRVPGAWSETTSIEGDPLSFGVATR